MNEWKTWTICGDKNESRQSLERLRLEKWSNNEIFEQMKKIFNEKLNDCNFKGKNKKNTTKDGDAIPYLSFDVSGANCTDLILVVNSLYIETI